MQYSDYKYTQVGTATIDTSSLTAEQKAFIKYAIARGKYFVIGETNYYTKDEWKTYQIFPVFSIDNISETIDTNDTITLGIRMFIRSSGTGFGTDFNIGFVA